jgi:glucose/mannose transport system substrate-binding protein
MYGAKSVVAAAALVGMLVLAACGGSSGTSSNGTASGKLEVFSWWTSGSENAALQELFKATNATYPGIQIVNAAVAGGAGTNAKQVLATRLSAGDIPETWQTHPGGELGDFVSQGVLADLSDLYAQNGWNKVVPKELIDSMTYNGKVYAVLTGVHRGNVLWTNKADFAKAGVSLGPSVTWSDIQAAAKGLQAQGIAPLCLGDKDIWTAAQLLEAIVVGEVGGSGWMGLLKGTMKWSDPKVATAVAHFNEALTWTNKDHKALDWTGAVAALASGTCAMNLMGDWAYGELIVKQQKVDGKDFGYSIIGDAQTFVTVGDAFGIGKGSKNPAAAKAWIQSIMTTQAQAAFNKLKGSATVRSDVDLSSFGTYQQGAAKTLASGVKVPSLTQGQALVKASVTQAYSDAVTFLEANQNAAAFGKSMDAAVAAG